jgi:hypothetical protein
VLAADKSSSAIKALYDFMLKEPGALTEEERETVLRLSKEMDEGKQDRARSSPIKPARA